MSSSADPSKQPRASLKHAGSWCDACPLRKTRVNTRYVPTDICGTRPSIYVYGEAPGHHEDIEGVPFVGASGTLLRKALREVFGMASMAFGNVVRCRPVDGDGRNREPTAEEIECCRNYLYQDIANLKPRVVIALGSTALHALQPGDGLISYERGWRTKLQLDGNSFSLVPTFHPAYILRNADAYGVWITDFRKARRAHQGTLDALEAPLSGVVTLTSLDDVLGYLNDVPNLQVPRIAVDTEGESLYRVAPNRMSMIQFASDWNTAIVIPLEHPQSPWSGPELGQIKQALGNLFRRKDIAAEHWVMANDKHDLMHLKRVTGVMIKNRPVINVQQLAFDLDENRLNIIGGAVSHLHDYASGFGLKTMVRDWCNYEFKGTEALESRADGSLFHCDLYNVTAPYGGEDACTTLRLCDAQIEDLEDEGRWDRIRALNDHMYSPMSRTFVHVEHVGVPADIDHLRILNHPTQSPILARLAEIDEIVWQMPETQAINTKLAGTTARVANMSHALFGKRAGGVPRIFSITKPNHRRSLLFDAEGFGLEPLDWTVEEEGKVNKAFYAAYEGEPVVDLISEHSQLTKLHQAYSKSVIAYIDPDNPYPDCVDGRVRTSINAIFVITGRTNSVNPNLQQIPRPSSHVRQLIRNMYYAPVGQAMVEADVRQSEVRWWAQASGDPALIQLFCDMYDVRMDFYRNPTKEKAQRVKTFCDIHRQVASLMFGIPITEVTSEQRQAAKCITFGIQYGKTYKSLAHDLGVSPKRAKELMDIYFSGMPVAAQWLFDTEAFAQAHGFIESPMGRRRHLPVLLTNPNDRHTLNQSRNSPIQVVSSDANILIASLLVDKIEENELNWQVFNVVHDALYSLVPIEELPLYVDAVEDIAHEPAIFDPFGITMKVPIEVEFKIGGGLGFMREWDVGANNQLPAIQKWMWDQQRYGNVNDAYQQGFFDMPGCAPDNYMRKLATA